ncbi:MAG TPA: hypothetical protein VD706_02155, partial [Candidatus Saccharimonadales bacterium]|nr:hypothetical protein [Candidatus Saccharimonadales bacterium]
MFKVSQVASSIPGGECPFADQCAAGDAFCEATQIIADGEHYKRAKSLGLKPELEYERWLTDNFDSDAKLAVVRICSNGATDPEVAAGVGQFIQEVSPTVLIEDPEQWATLQELEGIVRGNLDIDEVSTDAGMSLLDRITGGETVS